MEIIIWMFIYNNKWMFYNSDHNVLFMIYKYIKYIFWKLVKMLKFVNIGFGLYLFD